MVSVRFQELLDIPRLMFGDFRRYFRLVGRQTHQAAAEAGSVMTGFAMLSDNPAYGRVLDNPEVEGIDLLTQVSVKQNILFGDS